jgi:heat shock protein HtpX
LFFSIFAFATILILTRALGILMGYDVGGLGYLGFAFLLSGISTFMSYYYSHKIVLGVSGARKANENEEKVLKDVVENLSLGAGINTPEIYVIDDSAPNAFATGRDPKNSVVCVTSGLLQKLNRTELEGVIAHELTNIKNYDVRLMSLVSVMVGLIALLADWFLRISFWGGRNSDEKERGEKLIILALGLFFAALSPLIAQLIQLSISRRREFFADAGAVAITRQPLGLISALKKISEDHEPLEAANKATAHLYFENPFKDNVRGAVSWFSKLFNTHPPVEERIRELEKML